MARITPRLQDHLPNPSKVLSAEPPLSQPLLGNWSAASPRQAWTNFNVTADQRVKITAGNKIMSGVIEAQANGELNLTLYAGAGASTVQLQGTWQLHGLELRLEFKATDMVFVKLSATVS